MCTQQGRGVVGLHPGGCGWEGEVYPCVILVIFSCLLSRFLDKLLVLLA